MGNFVWVWIFRKFGGTQFFCSNFGIFSGNLKLNFWESCVRYFCGEKIIQVYYSKFYFENTFSRFLIKSPSTSTNRAKLAAKVYENP